MSSVDNSKKKQWVKATKNINPNHHQLDNHKLKIIARIRTEFPEKFGIPRQSGIVDSVKATIVFEPEYRNIDALRGMEGFTHIWLIWGFFHTKMDTWSPMVKPPRLGGNKRMGD